MANLAGKGSRWGATWFGRVGDIVQQPPVWDLQAVREFGQHRHLPHVGHHPCPATHVVHERLKTLHKEGHGRLDRGRVVGPLLGDLLAAVAERALRARPDRCGDFLRCRTGEVDPRAEP
ncbi:MAG: hypothetical protein M3P85_00110 [Actinomycetota bacterium]|nr:hypothetical protein [Actinomycetota bacterium]